VSAATGAAKARVVQDALGTYPFDPEWSTPALMRQNPLAWMVEIDGMVLHARSLPLDIQEQLVEMGVIPPISGCDAA
jgi:hypothetical protein